MTKILFLLSLFYFDNVYAELEKSPYQKYSTKNNFTNDVHVEWIIVDDIQKTCDDVRVKNKNKPFPYKVDACSEWGRNLFRQYKCKIYTKKMVNNDTLGHEIRHCFQGSFH